jgi:helicase
MKLSEIKNKLNPELYDIISKEFSELRPSQEKAIKAGLLEGKNLLVCSPTASGKTLIAEIAAMQNIMNGKGKAIYIVPLKALATEKFKDFKKKYPKIKTTLSIGDFDSDDSYLQNYDLIISTSEKMDSLIRHKAPWFKYIHTIIVDEVHLLNDVGRGPTLEILLTILRRLLKKSQIIALSATIGNPKDLAKWLDANLVSDSWRPVKLKKGVYLDGQIEFPE